MQEDNANLTTILKQAMGIQSNAQRSSFLDQTCGSDTQLRSRVDNLIEAYEQHASSADIQMDSMDLAVSVETFLFENEHSLQDTRSLGDTKERRGDSQLDETTPPTKKSQSAPTSTSTLIPDHAGRYQIVEEVARGGMGAVLLAHDPELDRKLAIKIMLVNGSVSEELEKRFLEESSITAGLQHPGIPPVHDRGRLSDGRAFFAMKLIEGKTFGELLAQRTDHKHDLPMYIGIFKQICQTIGFAHSRDILHRDIKPPNIMVGSFGEVQVMDWGLAKNINDQLGHIHESVSRASTPQLADNETADFSEDLTQNHPEQNLKTQSGTILGTPSYMAPEQARGEIKNVDKRSDVFGLGSILCEILTGKPTFVDKRVLDRIRKSAANDVKDAYRRLDRCGADDELIQLAKTCLNPDPGQRPSDAGRIAETISTYEQNIQNKLQEAEIRRAESEVKMAEEEKRFQVETEKRKAERQRNRLLLSLAAALLVLTIGGSIVANWYATNRAMISARQEYLEKDVEQALAETETIRNKLIDELNDPLKFHTYTSNLGKWEAESVLIRNAFAKARSLIDGDTEKLLSAKTLANEKSLAELLRVDQDQLDLAQKLDNIILNVNSGRSSGSGQKNEISKQLRAAFKSSGIDFSGEENEIINTITSRPHYLFIISAIDFWTTYSPNPKETEFLRILNPKIDKNETNNQIRSVIKNGNLWDLQELVNEISPQQHSPQLLLRLAGVISNNGGDGSLLLKKAILKHPQDFWLHFGKAVEQTDLKEQINSYRTAIAIRPNSEIAYNNIAVAFARDRQMDNAIEHWKRSIEINSEHDTAHFNLGKAYMMTDKVDEAIIQFKRAIEINANYTKAYAALGQAYEGMGELDKAIETYGEAIAVDPNNSKIQIDLGIAWDLKEEPEKAITHFKKALEIQPDYHIAYANWADALIKLDKLPEALKKYNLAIKHAPNGHPAKRTYIQVAEKLQEKLKQ